MNREEFMKLNPCIEKAACSKRISQQDIITQASFLSKRTFIFDKLRVREAEVLKLRFGIEDGVMHTQQQIAQMLDISTARTQQLERAGLLRLSKLENIDLLMKYDDKTAKNMFIKDMVKHFDYRSLIFKDIQSALLEGKVKVNINSKIHSLYIPSSFCGSIKKKLVSGGITTTEQLLDYLKNHDNLKEFGLGNVTYSAVVFAIVKLIENKSVVLDSKDILISYHENKAKYLNYLTVNNLTDKTIFPEIKAEEEETKTLEDYSQVKGNMLYVAEKILKKDLSVALIDELGLSPRTYNALRRAHIVTIRDLIEHYYDNNKTFTSIKCLSVVGENDILNTLHRSGICLEDVNLRTI